MFLLDPRSLEPVPRRPRTDDSGDDAQEDSVEAEMYAAQVETSTEPASTADELHDRLVRARRTAARTAAHVGADLMASSTAVVGAATELTDDDRYREMVVRHGPVARQAAVCGMHVHVEVGSDHEAVRVVDAIAPWLPVVAAVSAASPYAQGDDTGFASWRAHCWDQWPTAGAVEPFGDVATYRSAVDALVASGAAHDDAMVYFDARLGRGLPTVEIRVCDVQPDLADAVTLAVLLRALVTTAAERSTPRPRTETLRAARWLARRDGVDRELLHPIHGRPVPASDAVQELLDHCEPALREAGDAAHVEREVTRMAAGGGAPGRLRAVASGDAFALAQHLVSRTTAALDG